jgi:DNA (cytosine-5)-methyltransferase 1
MKDLIAEGRPPRIIALENVCGTLTSHEGKDFGAICSTFERAGYVFGAVVVDAALFVPQSRPRLFMIGVRGDVEIPPELAQSAASPLWHTRGLRTALDNAPAKVRRNWIWWSLPEPTRRNTTFADLVEDNPSDVEWHTPAETRRLLGRREPSEAGRRKGRQAQACRRDLQAHALRRDWLQGSACGNPFRRHGRLSANAGGRLQPADHHAH